MEQQLSKIEELKTLTSKLIDRDVQIKSGLREICDIVSCNKTNDSDKIKLIKEITTKIKWMQKNKMDGTNTLS